jgi:hypothetical protein
MRRWRRRAKRQLGVALAVVLVLGLLIHSILWAAFIVFAIYVLWRIPAKDNENRWKIRRPRSPVGWGHGVENAGRGRERDVHEYADRMTKKISR